jgi:membrane associated rhomboid family serine protease
MTTTRPASRPSSTPPGPWLPLPLLLVAAHLVRILVARGYRTPPSSLERCFRSVLVFAGMPSLAGLPPYANAFEAFLPMVASAFIHADWMHVILNAAFLVALAKPLLELMRGVWPGREPAASILLLALFLFAQVASSLTFLALSLSRWRAGGRRVRWNQRPSGCGPADTRRAGTLAAQPAIPGRQRLFVVANAVFAFIGPSLLGANIAWQAHVGGYVGGALFMRMVLWRMQLRRA